MKVVAPGMSFSASGKLGKALVYFTHLGRNVVRGLVTPANPKTEFQGDNRLLLGALGRAAKGPVDFSLWKDDILQTVPAGQTWVSAMIRNAIDFFGKGQTGVAALAAAVTGHAETAIWESEGALAGFTNLEIDYAGTVDTLTPGAMLYALAQHTMLVKASNPSLFDRTPYTVALASWDSSNIEDFREDLQTVPTP